MDLTTVRGFKNLTKAQQDLFTRVYKKHMAAIDNKKGWEPKQVSVYGNCLKVTFKNGEWLHYTRLGEWY